jgi:hypothetical protein
LSGRFQGFEPRLANRAHDARDGEVVVLAGHVVRPVASELLLCVVRCGE